MSLGSGFGAVLADEASRSTRGTVYVELEPGPMVRLPLAFELAAGVAEDARDSSASR